MAGGFDGFVDLAPDLWESEHPAAGGRRDEISNGLVRAPSGPKLEGPPMAKKHDVSELPAFGDRLLPNVRRGRQLAFCCSSRGRRPAKPLPLHR